MRVWLGGNGSLRVIGMLWGLGGVMALLVFAVWRLASYALELMDLSLGVLHWAALVLSVGYMIYAEGYKGFHLGFAPRVVVRAQYLWRNPAPGLVLLAPLFCMGFVHATRRRRLATIGLTVMILCFIVIARQLPQPWRGILDAGVVAGLSFGIASLCYFAMAALGSRTIDIPADTPEAVST